MLGVSAGALVRLDLAERRGASKTARPTNPGYSYRLTSAGSEVLAVEAARWAARGIRHP